MHGGASSVPTCVLCCFNVRKHAAEFAARARMQRCWEVGRKSMECPDCSDLFVFVSVNENAAYGDPSGWLPRVPCWLLGATGARALS